MKPSNLVIAHCNRFSHREVVAANDRHACSPCRSSHFRGSLVALGVVGGWFNSRRFLDELYRVCSTGRARFTYEHSAIELSILLCISEAHDNFVEQTKSALCRAANRAAVADRRRVAHNRRPSGSGGAFTFDRRAFWTRLATREAARL